MDCRVNVLDRGDFVYSNNGSSDRYRSALLCRIGTSPLTCGNHLYDAWGDVVCDLYRCYSVCPDAGGSLGTASAGNECSGLVARADGKAAEGIIQPGSTDGEI